MWTIIEFGFARSTAAALLCLASAACTSQETSTETRERWCGTGGGAARGAILGAAVPVVAGAQTGPYGLMLGVVLAPAGLVVGGVVGAVDGGTKNPCPDVHAASNEPQPEEIPADATETDRRDRVSY